MITNHTRTTLIAILCTLTLACAAHGAPFQFSPPFSPKTPTTGQGATSAQANPDEPEGLTGPQDTFWRRAALTGDWDDLRNQLLYKGIAITPVYIGEVFGNTGGADQGLIADGLFNVALDLDLERITGFWKNAILHANALYIYGTSLSSRYVGDFSNTSNLSGYNSVRLQEVWLEQGFWDKRASLRLGMLAADSEFFTSDDSSLFINGTFGAFTLIGSNFADAPIYPIANPGIRLFVQPVSKFYFQAAAFAPDSNSDPTSNNSHGTHFHINDSDGALLMTELGYLFNQSPNDRGLVGTYKLGAFVQRGNYPTFSSQADDALGTGKLSGKGTNFAVYGVANQEIYKHGGSTISAFLRGGFSPGDLSFVDRYLDAGFNFTGFIPGRPIDVGGIAVGHSWISDDFSRADQRQGNPPDTSETVIEATYQINLAPWWNVQPDFQYIINPSGVKGSDDAAIFGVRTAIVF